MSRDRIQPATGGPDAAAADRWGAGAGPDTASLPAGIDGVLIDGIADWLISSALGRVGVDAIFDSSSTVSPEVRRLGSNKIMTLGGE